MDREENEEKAGQEPPQKKKSSLKKWLVIGVVGLVVVVAVSGGGMFYFSEVAGTKEKASPQKPVMIAVWPMEPFIVNLIDNTGERYLKVVIQLEVSHQNCLTELDLLKPRLRDSILDLLSAKSPRDLLDINGKQRLREEIITRLNTFLTTGKVVRVYFTEFVMQ